MPFTHRRRRACDSAWELADRNEIIKALGYGEIREFLLNLQNGDDIAWFVFSLRRELDQTATLQ